MSAANGEAKAEAKTGVSGEAKTASQEEVANAKARKMAADAAAKLEAERLERVERWADRKLSVWYIRTGVETNDVMAAARKSANNTGMPQRVLWISGGKTAKVEEAETVKTDVVEPKRGGDGMGDKRPNWVRKIMGDM